MNWRRLRCTFGRHDFGLPIPSVRALYVRCIRCGHRTRGIEVIGARETVDVPARLKVLHGRAQQLRMRILG